MPSRLRTYCLQIIEAGWLVAVAVTPLHFNPVTSRIFEPNKMLLLRSIAVVMAAAWLVAAATRWLNRPDKPSRKIPPPLLRNGIFLSALLFLAITALAALFSVLPQISLWGYLERMAGLYTTASYLVFFLAVGAYLRTPDQLQRLVTTILLASLPVALYALIQEVGVDPLPWVEAADGRARSMLGYPAALAAMMALVMPLTLLRLVDARRQRRYLLLAAYVLLLGLQVAAILFARSRGPVLGLAAGLFFGGLIWSVLHHWRRTALALIGSSLALVVCLVVINLPNSPLAFVQDLPFLDRITRLSDAAGSTQGRVLIWQGATDLLAEKPERLPLGYGPDTIRFVLYPHYTADLGRLHGWRAFVDRAHSETFDVLITTGLLGLLGYLLLFTSIVYYGLRWLGLTATRRQRLLFLSLWALGGVLAVGMAWWIGQTWAFTGVALPLGLLAGLFCYLSVCITAPSERPPTPDLDRRYVALTVALVVGLLAHFVETNVGIAVSTTNLFFWIYAALLLVIGLFFAPRSQETPPQVPPETTQPVRSNKKKKKQRKSASTGKARTQTTLPALALVVGLMLTTLVYGFTGFMEESRAVQGLIGGTWLGGGVLLLPSRRRADLGRQLRDAGLYAVLSLSPLVLFVWLRAVFFQRLPSQALLFYGLLFGLLGGMAFALYRLAPPAERKATLRDLALLAVALLGAGWMVYQTNVQPTLANLYHREAQVAFQKRQYDVAATSYWHTTDLDPAQDLYKLEYAQLLATKAHYRTPDPAEQTQLYQEAERILQAAMATNPYEQYHPAALAEVYRLWAKSTVDPGQRDARFAQAAAAYDQALAINWQNVLLWQQAATLYEEMGDTERARQAYERMLTWDSTNAGLHQRLAALYQANNEIPKAIAAYEALLRLQKQPQPLVHHTLATLYEQTGRLEEAVQASEQAVALGPNVLAYYTTLINLYQKQGRCRDALARAETAIERWPDQPSLHTNTQALRQRCNAATDNE